MIGLFDSGRGFLERVLKTDSFVATTLFDQMFKIKLNISTYPWAHPLRITGRTLPELKGGCILLYTSSPFY